VKFCYGAERSALKEILALEKGIVLAAPRRIARPRFRPRSGSTLRSDPDRLSGCGRGPLQRFRAAREQRGSRPSSASLSIVAPKGRGHSLAIAAQNRCLPSHQLQSRDRQGAVK